MSNQATISDSYSVEGVNVFNGRRNNVTFHPAEENCGIRFFHNGRMVRATLENAFCGKGAFGLANFLGVHQDKTKIRLTEHILGAVYGLGIDNLDIELSDGTCPTFLTDRMITIPLRERKVDQATVKTYWEYASLSPREIYPLEKLPDIFRVGKSESFDISTTAYYPHLAVGRQDFDFEVTPENFMQDISGSRPPAFLSYFARPFLWLEERGMHGINSSNYLLTGPKDEEDYLSIPTICHSGGRCFYDHFEFVRHKILDLLGLLALTGKQFKRTHFGTYLTGHKTDLTALRKCFAERDFEEVQD